MRQRFIAMSFYELAELVRFLNQQTERPFVLVHHWKIVETKQELLPVLYTLICELHEYTEPR